MSTTIKVPVSVLQEKAQQLQGYADENEDIFKSIYNSLLCLEGSGEWKGTSLTAAANATRSNREKFSDVVSEMRDLANMMQKFADEMAAKDTEIRDQINAISI